MNIPWSHEDWLPWQKDVVEKIPTNFGVYEIKVGFEIERLKCKSPLLYIGVAQNLHIRLMQEYINPEHFLNRAGKWLIKDNHKLTFRYAKAKSREEAGYWEEILLWEYENKHYELPPGNDHLEKSVIKKKLEQKVGDISRKKLEIKLNGLLLKYSTIPALAKYLELPVVIVENLFTYKQL
jgi:hypothetical protein